MKLRVAAFVVVLLMILMSFSAVSRNGPVVGLAAAASTSSGAVNGTANLTAPAAPLGAATSTSMALTSPFPTGIISGQTTYVYNFDSTAEGFTKPIDYTYSDVQWNSTNHNIYILSDRRDPGDERLVHTTPTLDTTADFTITARWKATTQGNWQIAFPLFLMASSNTQVLTSNSILFYYTSRDSNLGYAPWYYLIYYDASGVQRNLGTFIGQVNTEYHFFIHYDSSVKLLRMEIRSATDVTLFFAQYLVGSHPNDGFTLGQVGASAHGYSSTLQPATVAWTDDISVTYATGAYRDAVLDQGDGNVKIGWLADNFNNNANNGWTVEGGTASWAGGVMALQSNTIVHIGTSWYDQQFQFDATFTVSGGLTAYFRVKDPNNLYEFNIVQGAGTLSLCKAVAGNVNCIGTVSMTIALNTAYTFEVVARGNYFEMWAGSVLKWSGTDTSPPSPLAGYVRYGTDSARVNIDNVRLWNTAQGSFDTAVANAGSKVPLSTMMTGTVDAYNQTHVYVRSSANNVAWDNWTLLKADVAAATSYAFPDQERQKYYQIRVVLSSGMNGTAFFTSFTTTTGTASTNPTATAGSEPWYTYVGGLVNAVNQNLYYAKQDFAFQGRAFTLAVVRSYNSVNNGISGPFGIGWTFNYNEFLTVNGDNSVTWTDGTGAAQTFLPKATAGMYSPPRGIPDRLLRNADQSFSLSRPDGSRELFSSAGRLASITDRNGNKLTFTYDASNRLTRVADDAGKALIFTWNTGLNQVSQVTDPMGRTVNYTYLSGSGNSLGTVTDPMGFVESYSYQSSPTVLASITDPAGKVTWFTYARRSSQVTEVWLESKVGGVVQYQFREYAITVTTTTTRTITNARGYTTTLTLNSFGNPTQVAGPAACSGSGGHAKQDALDDQVGNSTSYVWDGEMNKMQRVDARGDAWSVSYGFRTNPRASSDPGANESVGTWIETNSPTAYRIEPISQTNPRGFTTSSVYDSKGNEVQSIDAGGNISQMAYDASGFLNKTVSARGYTVWYVYNGSGWLVTKTDPLNDVTRYGYDILGRLTSVTSPLGFVSSTSYDRDGRVTKSTDPLQHATTFGYDARGGLLNVTDPDLFVSRFTINVTNGLTQTSRDPSGNLTFTNAYDLRNNLVARTDADGHLTRCAFDIYDRVSSATTPLNEVTSYAYDGAGNRIRRTDGNGVSTIYSYDKLNRLYQVHYPAGSVYLSPQTLTYLHDSGGNLVSATGFGYSETRAYDGSDRVSSTSFNYGSFIATVGDTYDADGNRVTLMDSSGGTTTYAYDPVDRQSKVTDPEGYVTSFFYDRDGRANLTLNLGGVKQVNLYDAASRVTAMYTNGSFGMIQEVAYTYDNAGYRLSETDYPPPTGTTTTYAYDRAHRLYKTVQGSSTTVDTYDAVGNLAQEIAGITYTYAYNADNEMTYANQTGGSSYSNTYDADGNRVSWTNGAPGGNVYYTYDYENRLIVSGRGIVPYTNDTYSPTGERVASSQLQPSVVTTYYGYDYASPGGTAVIADYASTSARQDRYTQTGATMAPVELYTSGNHYAYQPDALGSVRRITDGGGGTVDTYAYDAWGGTTQTGSLFQPFQYAAMPLDSTDSLYYAQARFYDPAATGGHRFLGRDPIGGGYAYAKDSPTNFVDPSGMASFWAQQVCVQVWFWSNCYVWWKITLSEAETQRLYDRLDVLDPTLAGISAFLGQLLGGVVSGLAAVAVKAAGWIAFGYAAALWWFNEIDAMGGHTGVFFAGQLYNGWPTYSYMWHN